MMFLEDKDLTPDQVTLKWSLYCECEGSEQDDITTVLKSLLKDLEKVGSGVEVFEGK